MANQDMFMKIDGVKGCTLDSAEKGSIDLLDWNWGLVQTGSSHHMSGSGEGKVIAHDLTFTKYQDASSATIYQFCATGKHVSKATLLIRHAGTTPQPQMEIEMTQVLVTGVSGGHTDSNGSHLETVTLNFAEFQVKSHGQASSGSDSATTTFKYSLAENKAS